MEDHGPQVNLPKYKDPITKMIMEGITPLSVLMFLTFFIVAYILIKRFITLNVEGTDLPRIHKDMTVEELRQYDGNNEEGRVMVAVNGFIFDVTRSKRFYGPGGPYAAFGGRDASRGLATFSVTSRDLEYDDLSDLNSMQMESVKEWEGQFRDKYELVGRLLRPGEEPSNYSEDEFDENDFAAAEAAEQERKNK